mmetsp:Transcript_59650/g.134606  ORF Transcript_59650/g.134606 Transcript_59650/m.134606 type:complete len:339 (-) Transcript_59650:56-1072(-)
MAAAVVSGADLPFEQPLPSQDGADCDGHAGPAGAARAASSLERRALELAAQLRDGERQLAIARREAAAARAARGIAAQTAPAARRASRNAAARLEEAQAALRKQEEVRQRREQECRGLRRTVARLRQKIGSTKEEAAHGRGVVAEAGDAEDALIVEEQSLEQAISSMEGVQRALERRIAAEKERRLRLKVSADAKFQRVEERLQALRAKVRQHEAELAVWEKRAAEQEANAADARTERRRWREAADRAGATERWQQEERQAMYSELVEARRSQMQLQSTLEATLEHLDFRVKAEAEAQRQWRLRHLEQVDARANARRSLEEEIVVADASDSVHCAGAA